MWPVLCTHQTLPLVLSNYLCPSAFLILPCLLSNALTTNEEADPFDGNRFRDV